MRIALAHPQRLIREAVRRSLLQSDLALIWTATDGGELRRMRQRDPPDLLLLDASLVGEDARLYGLDGCTWLVLAEDDCATGVYEALSAGALGHLQPPQLEADGELVGASRLLTRIRRLQTLIGTRQAHPAPSSTLASSGSVPIIALGASTGGPQALAQVLAGLPAGLEAAVIVVQHIDGEFSGGLVEWLASNTLLPVTLAQRGESLRSGHVYIGATEGHLVLLASQQLTYQPARPSDLHVPGIDMLFASLAANGRPGAAALLSGMGNDGASGLLQMRQAGWFTLAQDEGSCAVFGMPRAALENGAAQQALPPNAIGPALARHMTTSGRSGRVLR
ncbi:MAG TPA: chemotaxis protein CheB [Xanthomonadales bacterium]|nr:chemotaxis protein CheB [Xanthomonadales bacterium]